MGSVELQGKNHSQGKDYNPEKSYHTKPLWIRVSIALSGAVMIGLFALAGSESVTPGDVTSAFTNLLLGALSPTEEGYKLLIQLYNYVTESTFSQVLAFTALYMAAFNLLPAPLNNGGAAIMEALPLSDKTVIILNSFGLLFLVLFFGSWAFAVLNAI